MAGKRGRSGRKPLSIAEHILRGTYRADRHGPRPTGAAPGARPVSIPPVAAGLLDGLGAGGLALVQSHLSGFDDWHAKDLALLRQAGEARDRQVALQTAIDEAGVVVDGMPNPLLRAERQSGAAVVTALRALDIRPAPALPAERRA